MSGGHGTDLPEEIQVVEINDTLTGINYLLIGCAPLFGIAVGTLISVLRTLNKIERHLATLTREKKSKS